jgi:hypothetical protein
VVGKTERARERGRRSPQAAQRHIPSSVERVGAFSSLKNPADVDRIKEGLIKAGLPG